MKKTISLPVACLLSLAAFGVFAADPPDAEMKLSSNSLNVNQTLDVTFSSKVYCQITVVATGLDDGSKDYKPRVDAIFNPPQVFKFTFAKPGRYRIFAEHATDAKWDCGNMSNVLMMADIVVKRTVNAPLAISPAVLMAPPKATAPATPAIPADTPKPCAMKNGKQVDPKCVAE